MHSSLRPSCRPCARTRKAIQNISCWSCCSFLRDQPTPNIKVLLMHLLAPHGNVQCLLFQGIVLPVHACTTRQRQSYSISCRPVPKTPAGGVHRATSQGMQWGTPEEAAHGAYRARLSPGCLRRCWKCPCAHTAPKNLLFEDTLVAVKAS